MSKQNRNYDCRVSEFTIGKIPALALENNIFRVGILAGKGGDIYELVHKETDTDIMYRSKAGLSLLEKPSPSKEDVEGNFWENFIGGWLKCFLTLGMHATIKEFP